MKKLLFIIALIFVMANAHSQTATTKIDAFTGDKSVRTTMKRIGTSESGFRVDAQLVSVDKNLFTIYVHYFGDLGCMVQGESTLKLKLVNEEVLDFIQITNTDCSVNGHYAGFLPVLSGTKSFASIKKLLLEHGWAMIRLEGSRYITNITAADSEFFQICMKAINDEWEK
jgi:hypothetical protein